MPIVDAISYPTAFILGLLGGAHCLGMCGGIVSALSFSTSQGSDQPAADLPMLLAYNGGRILSYTLAGILLGSLGWLLAKTAAGIGLRSLAGLMLIAMGLYIGNWWRGLTRLEQLGGRLWRYIQPSASRLLPVTTPSQALLVGVLWGWLPCGLVYSVLIWASAAGSWQQSAMLMLSFGLGTLPVMLTAGLLAQQLRALIQHRLTRSLSGVLIIGFGIATLPWQMLLHR